jgi:hypothetical protein
LARLTGLAGAEREATAELVAHLAALDSRRSLFLARGYSSLFAYCTQVLRFSEDAACSRIRAARACRRLPVVLEHLASGAVSLTAVRLLARHLTRDNHASVLARARGATRRQLDMLVAELAPRRDAPTLVRRLPGPPPAPGVEPSLRSLLDDQAAPTPQAASEATPPAVALPSAPPSRVEPTSPRRYRVQFTIDDNTHDTLLRLQTLLRREIPDGDPGAIFARAATLLLEKVERTKLGHRAKPRAESIRPGTDRIRRGGRRKPTAPVRSAVATRDAHRCAFVSSDGHRCTETEFLEFHHRDPAAFDGGESVTNMALFCRPHNGHEAELSFGPYTPSASP